MKKISTVAIIALVAVVVAVLWVGGMYNRLVVLDESVKTQWANVEASYQRRADLIPNVVSTVRGAANFEQQTLTAVVEARAKATSITIDPSSLNEESLARFQQAQAGISSSLGRLLAVAENYPQLRSVDAFRDLQVQLEGTENRINVARSDFNNTVQNYNATVRSFPNVVIARLFGFSPKPQFVADAGANVAPKVDFGTSAN
jgi:LemA protein